MDAADARPGGRAVRRPGAPQGARRAWVPPADLPADDPQPRELHRPSTAATLNLAAVAAQGARWVRAVRQGVRGGCCVPRARAFDAARATPDLLAPAEAARRRWPVRGRRHHRRRLLGGGRAVPGHGEGRTGTPSSTCGRIWTRQGDVFDPKGFEWNRVAAWARLRLATRRSRRGRTANPARPAVGHHGGRRDPRPARRQPCGQPYVPEGDSSGGRTAAPRQSGGPGGGARPRGGGRTATPSSGVDYLFGRNALGLSYVTGYGARDVQRPHHRMVPTSSTRPCRSRRPARCPAARTPPCPDPVRRTTVRRTPAAAAASRTIPVVHDQRGGDQLERAPGLGRVVPGRRLKGLDTRVSWAHRHRPGDHR